MKSIIKIHSLIIKERERLKPKRFHRVIAFISGLTVWIRFPYNLIKGLSPLECSINEKVDLWVIGINYRN